MKACAKRAKVSKRETKKVVESLSVSDISAKRDKVRNEKSKLPSTKVHRPIIAAGGLDADMREWGVLRSSDSLNKRQAGRAKAMKEEMKSIASKSNKAVSIKKHFKPSNHSFKSKKRFKRR